MIKFPKTLLPESVKNTYAFSGLPFCFEFWPFCSHRYRILSLTYAGARSKSFCGHVLPRKARTFAANFGNFNQLPMQTASKTDKNHQMSFTISLAPASQTLFERAHAGITHFAAAEADGLCLVSWNPVFQKKFDRASAALIVRATHLRVAH